MKKTIFVLTLIILVSTVSLELKAQSHLSAGGFLGGGFISGNLPSQGSFSSSIFVEANTNKAFGFDTRLSFVYVADIDLLFPRSSISYYPFVKGFSIKGIVRQPLSTIFFFEEGLGPLALNDRTFSDINSWDYGLAFSILAGTNFGDSRGKIKLGAGIEYGLTFTKTTVRYSSFHLQIQYTL
ncbi:MAG: hypothetical protein ACYCVH_07500 [Ignavibacteriaceae bacterium]